MRTSDWFGGDPATGLHPVHTRADVTFFVDAPEYYAELRRSVERAGEGALICWAGFQSGATTPMPAGPPDPLAPKPVARRSSAPDDAGWLDLLACAAGRGAWLRVLLNLHPDPSSTYRQANLDIVEALNLLPGSGAINDFRYLHGNGTHHQKLVVVHDGRRLAAFVATMDVRAQRIEERWCEVAARLRGAAARDVYRVFHDRWTEHDATLALLPADRRNLPAPEELRLGRGPGRAQVQIAETYGNPTRAHPLARGRGRRVPGAQVVNAPHRFEFSGRPQVWFGNEFFTEKDPCAPALVAAARTQAPSYAFAPTGRHAIHEQLRAALARPSRTIYLEDQYLVEDQPMGELESMLSLLAARVADPQFRSLVVLTTRLAEIDRSFLGLAGAHRRAFVSRLLEAGGDKVLICQYRSNLDLGTGAGAMPSGSPFYVHSKTWVFDDELVVTGSANCNRRGYSHDSELNVAVADPRLGRDLRRRLWYNRLNAGLVRPAVTLADLDDPIAATRFWADPARYGLRLENHRIGAEAFTPSSSVAAPSSLGEVVSDRVARAYRVGPTRLHRWLWDTVIDPEGT